MPKFIFEFNSWLGNTALNYLIINISHFNIIENIMSSLVTLFCIKYTTNCCKKRKYLLYFAVELLTEYVPTNIELISDKNLIEVVIEQIHQVYKQIKKNEHSPNTEYLFNNLESQNNFEQSVKKLEMLQSMDFIPKLS